VIKTLIVATVCGAVAYWAAGKYVIKWTASDQGFVDAGPGFGWDDVAAGVTIGVTYVAGAWLLKKAGL